MGYRCMRCVLIIDLFPAVHDTCVRALMHVQNFWQRPILDTCFPAHFTTHLFRTSELQRYQSLTELDKLNEYATQNDVISTWLGKSTVQIILYKGV